MNLFLIKGNPCKGKVGCQHAHRNGTGVWTATAVTCPVSAERLPSMLARQAVLLQGSLWAMDSQSRPSWSSLSPKSALQSVPASTLIFLNWEKIDYSLPVSQYRLGSMAFHSGSTASQLFPPFFSIGKRGCTYRYHTGALFLAPLLKDATVILTQKHILGWLYPTPRDSRRIAQTWPTPSWLRVPGPVLQGSFVYKR